MSKDMEDMPVRCFREDYPTHNDRFNVADVISDIQEDMNKQPWTRKVGHYHPSSVKGCARSMYYDRIGETPVPCVAPKLRMLFDLGHAAHGMIEDVLKEYPDFESEVPVKFEPLNIYGHCDGVFGKEDWVLEIKTIGDASFKTLTKPKVEHLWQIHCYMFALDIPRCQLIYVNRNNGHTRLFRVLFENDIWDQVAAKISSVEACVESGEPPPQEVNWFMCSSCKFKKTCNPDLNRSKY